MQLYKYITRHNELEFFAFAWSLRWKQMVHLILCNIYAGRSLAPTEPWTVRDSKTAVHSTMIDTLACTIQLDRLSIEAPIEILLQLDIPSLTRFRSLSHCTMQFANSVCQYTAIIEHCPDNTCAILSVQADVLDCYTAQNAFYDPMFHLQSLW